MFTLPGIVAGVSMEKGEKLWAMMTMSGTRRAPYLAGHWAAGVVTFLPTGVAYVAVGYLAGSASFVTPSPGLFVALLLVWAHAQSGWGILLGALIPSARLASILCYLLAVGVALANLLITANYTPWPPSLTWVPLLSYARASTLVLTAVGSPTGTRGAQIWEALGITFLQGTLALLVGSYLHAVLPGPEQAGVTLHPLFPLLALQDALRGAGCGGRDASLHKESLLGAPEEGGGTPDATRLVTEAVDADVAAEEERAVEAASSSARGSGAILISRLQKHYLPTPQARLWAAAFKRPTPLPKRAVDGVSLCVPYGETLGLLGPNGAGKTTIISALTGAARATRGGARISGLDVATQLAAVWRTLGVCPQFDCVWPHLSVRHTLEFYAAVKGVSGERMRGVVQRSAEKVGLDGDSFSMPAGKLSGGQRRRLSIAISLLGDPDVVFLDEPTTGLDPENRNGIHRILAAEKRAGRAVLLTTHSMDEADVLCDRIAIVASGKLRAVGTQQRLKHRFGSGYRLTLHLDATSPAALDATAARAHAFVVRALSPQALLLSRVGTSMTYVLPRGTDVAGVFAALDAVRGKGEGISEFGVSQASLEEVFVKVVRQAELT
jgi:ABC-type branched-subunit amino acid transport system ATPase component